MFDVLENIASEQSIESGIWHHIYVKDADGAQVPLFLDAKKTVPCEALIRSARSELVRKFSTRNQARNLTQIRRGKPGDVESAEKDIRTADLKGFALRLLALRNCDSAKPGEHKLTETEAMELGAKSNYQWLVEQVFEVSADDVRYGSVAAALGEPKGKGTSQKD